MVRQAIWWSLSVSPLTGVHSSGTDLTPTAYNLRGYSPLTSKMICLFWGCCISPGNVFSLAEEMVGRHGSIKGLCDLQRIHLFKRKKQEEGYLIALLQNIYCASLVGRICKASYRQAPTQMLVQKESSIITLPKIPSFGQIIRQQFMYLFWRKQSQNDTVTSSENIFFPHLYYP